MQEGQDRIGICIYQSANMRGIKSNWISDNFSDTAEMQPTE